MATQTRIGRTLRVETEYAGHTYMILYREGQEALAHQMVRRFGLPYLHAEQLFDDIGDPDWVDEWDGRPLFQEPIVEAERRPLPIDWKFLACVAFVAAMASWLR